MHLGQQESDIGRMRLGLYIDTARMLTSSVLCFGAVTHNRVGRFSSTGWLHTLHISVDFGVAS